MPTRFLERRLQHALHLAGRLTRSVTLGVRVLVRDGDGGVLLVRHTYISGWYLPGGAVDRGEPAETAAVREVREECGIEIVERPRLVSFHVNRKLNALDHVAFYAADAWQPADGYLAPSGEIAEAGFFPLGALPDELSEGSARRLREVRQDLPPHLDW